MLTDYSLIIAGILALGIAAQWLGWFTKKPAIIYLLAIGIVLGPVLGWVNPDKMLGDLLFPVISLGVAIILFEGALTLKFPEIKSHGRVVSNLVTIGTLVTIAVSSFAAWLFMGMNAEIALLFGALVCVTGPTVITPLLRSVRPNKTISNILRWEGIIIDPIGALLVVLVYEYIISGHSPFIFVQTLLLGLFLGIIIALALAQLLKKHWIPEYLQNVFTLATVLLVFAVSNAMIEESGLLTVTVMGIAMANIKNLNTEDILDFKESLSVLIISMLFIVLSARIQFAGFANMGVMGIAVLLVIMFIARPLSVWISALGSQLTRNEKLLLSWIAPRGIVAAAVSSLFVLKIQGSEGSEMLIPLVFTVIIGTVIIQSLTAKNLAIYLGVADPNPNGVLISGISPFAIKLGKALRDNGFDVVLASSSYDQTAKARMEGLNVYYGNAVSEHADRHLSLVGIGHLISLHARTEQNILAMLRYIPEFGKQQVYGIKSEGQQNKKSHDNLHEGWEHSWLFNQNITYNHLMSLAEGDASIRTTNISDNYTFEQYLADNPKNITLFAISPNQKLNIFSSKKIILPSKGWKVAALVPHHGQDEDNGQEAS